MGVSYCRRVAIGASTTPKVLHRSQFGFGSRRHFLLKLSFALLKFIQLYTVNVPGQPQLLKHPDAIPVDVDFIPLQAMSRGNRVRVMIVVPTLSKSQDCHPPVIGGIVASGEAA